MTVRIGLRVATGISAHSTSNGSTTPCGLLIGHRSGEGTWVERPLPCVNTVGAGAVRGGFSIDPRVVVNVRRSLARGPHSIVGFYYASRDERADLTSGDLEHLRLWPESVLLIRGPRDSGPRPFRAWARRHEETTARELNLELVAAGTARWACPE